MSADFGIYLHWPFCAAKCPYCDFNSHVRERVDDGRWASAIARELATIVSWQDTRPTVGTVFFGGGTPSLMSGQAVATVLDSIAALWPFTPDVEITLEANPNSAEQTRFRDYRAAGVNRLSLGVQALDDAALESLGRLHDAAEARAAIGWAQAVFPRVSFDLIYARPGQLAQAWRTELSEALSFGTEHLSLYQLTIEPGTAFATRHRQGALVLPGEDAAGALYEQTAELCEAAGLAAYEISNYARPGAEARHNLLYWRYGDYAGAGPGAHGRLTLGDARVATYADRVPERWTARVEQHGHALERVALSPREAAHEHLLMGLRLAEGLDLAAYEARWNVALPRPPIAALAEEGLLEVSNTRLTATARGRLLLDSVIAALAA